MGFICCAFIAKKIPIRPIQHTYSHSVLNVTSVSAHLGHIGTWLERSPWDREDNPVISDSWSPPGPLPPCYRRVFPNTTGRTHLSRCCGNRDYHSLWPGTSPGSFCRTLRWEQKLHLNNVFEYIRLVPWWSFQIHLFLQTFINNVKTTCRM